MRRTDLLRARRGKKSANHTWPPSANSGKSAPNSRNRFSKTKKSDNHGLEKYAGLGSLSKRRVARTEEMRSASWRPLPCDQISRLAIRYFSQLKNQAPTVWDRIGSDEGDGKQEIRDFEFVGQQRAKLTCHGGQR